MGINGVCKATIITFFFILMQSNAMLNGLLAAMNTQAVLFLVDIYSMIHSHHFH